MKPSDFDAIETEIFVKLGNKHEQIAVDVLHPRLVSRAGRVNRGYDRYGMPLKAPGWGNEHFEEPNFEGMSD